MNDEKLTVREIGENDSDKGWKKIGEISLDQPKTKTAKQLFLEKCFGQWFSKRCPEHRGENGIKSIALESWFGCAERFDVLNDEVKEGKNPKLLIRQMKLESSKAYMGWSGQFHNDSRIDPMGAFMEGAQWAKEKIANDLEQAGF